jgi:hypothetical protein
MAGKSNSMTQCLVRALWLHHNMEDDITYERGSKRPEEG